MFFRTIQQLISFALYGRRIRSKGKVLAVFRPTDFEPSTFSRGGMLRLSVKGQTCDVPMSTVKGYRKDMYVPVELVRERTTDEVIVIEVGAPSDA